MPNHRKSVAHVVSDEIHEDFQKWPAGRKMENAFTFCGIPIPQTGFLSEQIFVSNSKVLAFILTEMSTEEMNICPECEKYPPLIMAVLAKIGAGNAK